jgi:RNA polymerase sigma factor (sigma-70 family)
MASRSPDDRSITADGFARLLRRLDDDAERAAHEYERLRRALVKFFDWRGALSPEECADEALDRLIRRLEENTVVESVRAYAHGIARLVLLERQRAPMTSPLEEIADFAQTPAAQADEDQGLRACFDTCLEKMPTEERSVVTAYYEGERRAKILNRRRLATSLGVSDNALRIRVRRVRDKLERCVETCVGHQEGPS